MSTPPPNTETLDPKTKALEALVETINSTGGVVKHPDGTCGCAADEDWIDLADAYLGACQALGVAPKQSDAASE